MPDGPLGQVVPVRRRRGIVTVERATGREEPPRASWTTAGASSRACAPTRPSCRSTSPAVSPVTSATSSRPSCGGRVAHRSTLPDAALLLCDRGIAFDHRERPCPLVALTEADGAPPPRRGSGAPKPSCEAIARRPPPAAPPAPAAALRFVAPRGPEAYLANIAACRREIFEGESYEICLTTELRSDGAIEPVAAYRPCARATPRRTRRCCASARVRAELLARALPARRPRAGGRVRPIKGTAARAAHPVEDAYRGAALRDDEKSRAENLMIVDLVRNDLGRVSGSGWSPSRRSWPSSRTRRSTRW